MKKTVTVTLLIIVTILSVLDIKNDIKTYNQAVLNYNTLMDNKSAIKHNAEELDIIKAKLTELELKK